MLLAKSKLNSIEVLISKALINSNISHDQFVLINNLLEDFYDMKTIYDKKEEILTINKNLNYIEKQCYLIVWSEESKNAIVVKTINRRIMIFLNVQYVIAKNKNLLKNMNLEDY